MSIWKRLRGDRALDAAARRIMGANERQHRELMRELAQLDRRVESVEQKVAAQPRARRQHSDEAQSGSRRFGRFDDLSRYPESERPAEPTYLNVGAGRFRHPYWHNLDNPSDWYAPVQGDDVHIAHDLTSAKPWPIESGSLKAIYTSHVIEHLKDEHVESLFVEAWRTLQLGGVFRVVCPDMRLEYDAYARGDDDYFYWRQFPKKVLNREQPVETIFLKHFAAALAPGHPDMRVPKCEPDEIRRLFAELGREEFFNYLCDQVTIEVQRDHPGNHCNWFDAEKAIRMLRAVGFRDVAESRYGQSRHFAMRNTLLFDNSRPTSALYVEAMK